MYFALLSHAVDHDDDFHISEGDLRKILIAAAIVALVAVAVYLFRRS